MSEHGERMTGEPEKAAKKIEGNFFYLDITQEGQEIHPLDWDV